jgi:hypothetical protein
VADFALAVEKSMDIAIILVLVVGVLIWAATRTSAATSRLVDRQLVSHGDPASPGRDSFFEIGKHFFADVSQSPNGRFVVGACDRGGSNARGACALLEGGKTRFKKSIQRANNPHVTNEGMVLVEDWKDDGKLDGALLALDRNGELLWRRDFKANIDTSGLSEDGLRAFVSTCNSDNELHSGKTFFLDARTGAVLWKSDMWGNVRFQGNALAAEVRFLDGTRAAFIFDGEGQLGPEYAEACMSVQAEQVWGKHWAAILRMEKALKGGGVADVAEASRLVTALDGKESEIPSSSRAKFFRYRGDLAEAQGMLEQAQVWWERAIATDPKVGVKRKLAKLQATKAGA